jgi:hypothetical protein
MAAEGRVRPWDSDSTVLLNDTGQVAKRSEVHLAGLRAKLGRRDLIETIRGVGYRLSGRPAEVATSASN